MSTTPHSPTHQRRRFRTERDRGAVLPMVALMLMVLMTSTAFAVDLGRLRSARRSLQADADVIALDSMRVVVGTDAVTAKPLALTEANLSAARNGYDITITDSMLEVGYWEDNVFTAMSSATEFPNAVRVMLTDDVESVFDFATDSRSVNRDAYAVKYFGDPCNGGLACPEVDPPTTTTTGPTTTTTGPTTTTTGPTTTTTTCPTCTPATRKGARSRAELGSVLASFQFYEQPGVDPSFNVQVEVQATIMNQLLTEWLGISADINLGAGVNGSAEPVVGPATGLRADAVSYQGLANGYAALDDIAATMGFGNLSQLMGTQVSARDFLQASADVLTASGTAADVDAGTILGTIASKTDNSLDVVLGDWLQASSGPEGVLATRVNALDILHATAMIIDGNNFASVDLPITLPLVGAEIPTRVAIIEPPQTHRGFRDVGQAGPSTAQVKLAMEIPLDGITVDLTGISPLAGSYVTTGTLPIVVEVARADSIYGSMACPSEADPSFTNFGIESSAISVSYGDVLDADLQTAGDATIENSAMINGSVNLLGAAVDFATFTTVDHTETWYEGVSYTGNQSTNAGLFGSYQEALHLPPYPSPWIRYAGGADLIGAETYDGVAFTGTLAPVLNPTRDAIEAAVDAAVQPLIDSLDDDLLEPLLQSLGVTVAGTDARMNGLKCETVGLASVDD